MHCGTFGRGALSGRGRRRHTWLRLGLLVAAIVVGAGMAPGAARAAWCGTAAAADRPPVVAGPYVHVVYAYAGDGADRSVELAPRIESDVESIDAWWRGQDPARTPRFDLTPFACGLQTDLAAVRLTSTASELQAIDTRWRTIAAQLLGAGFNSGDAKYLVYYDGPADGATCGQGGGEPLTGPSFAIVYLGACGGYSSANVAAHELLHALGAMQAAGPLHPCPDSPLHPCDSSRDILYPYVNGAPLSELLLDAGRDDYYGFFGGWFDVEDSLWLRKLDSQVPLGIAVAGRGTVRSVEPGPECSATCSVEWDGGTTVHLQADPPEGLRLLRWSGDCTGEDDCILEMSAARSVRATFVQANFRLSVAVAGKGLVRSAPAGIACRARCFNLFTSFQPVRLRAVPATGWHLARWSGACAGRRVTCSVPLRGSSSVRALFSRNAR